MIKCSDDAVRLNKPSQAHPVGDALWYYWVPTKGAQKAKHIPAAHSFQGKISFLRVGMSFFKMNRLLSNIISGSHAREGALHPRARGPGHDYSTSVLVKQSVSHHF